MNCACLSEARVTAAAIRLNNGEIFTGPSTHFQAMEKIARAGYFDWPGITSPGGQDDIDTFQPYEVLATYAPEDGWMTSDGEFVNRAQAEDIARAAGQTKQYQGSLHSGDFDEMSESDESGFDEFDDDELGMRMSDMNVIAYPPGTKVRILSGKYTGELGTVQNSTRTMTAHEGERSYWVHVDWDSDPHSAIVYRQDQLQRVIGEAEDDDDLVKEVGQGYPRFEFEPFGSAYNHYTALVKVNGEFIGSLVKVVGKTKEDVKWHIAFLAKRKVHTYVPVSTPEEGAQKLWQEHTGLVQLPVVKEPYDPLPPDPDDPNHYESLRRTAKSLVAFLAEDPETDAPKTPKPIRLLQQAGFKITESTDSRARFSWPAGDRGAYFNGIRRAREIVRGGVFTEARYRNSVAELTVIFK